MKRILTSFLVASSLAVGLAAKTLNVVTTLPDLASLVKSVGGDKVNVTSIVVGARDPHRIEAKPSYMSRAAQADLWLAVGLELEIGYEGPIIDGSRNSRIQPGSKGHAYAAEWVKVLDVPSGHVTRAEGDIHPFGNPHIWLDPYNGRLIALGIAKKLGEIDPQDAAYFEKNAEAFAHALDTAMFGSALVAKYGGPTLWQWDNSDSLIPNLKKDGMQDKLGGWAAKMHPYWGSGIVTYHRSLVYLASRFGLKIVGELEPKPGLEPTPGHMAGIITLIDQKKVKAIIEEPFYSTRNAQFVSQRTGVPYVVIPGSVTQDPAAKDYITLFDTIVSRLSDAFAKGGRE